MAFNYSVFDVKCVPWVIVLVLLSNFSWRIIIMCGCNSIFVGLQPPVPVYILPIEINNTAGECVRYIRTGLYIIRTSMSDILCLPLEQ